MNSDFSEISFSGKRSFNHSIAIFCVPVPHSVLRGFGVLFETIQKGGFIFLFDVLFGPFRETYRVKGCDKNVSLFLIVRKKMAYPGLPNKRI